MRSDFLYLISSQFDGRIGEPLMNSTVYHLGNFDQEQASAIIERSVRKANLPFEPRLSREVARDLGAGGVVLPSELQIVGDRLQSKRIFTLDAYRRAGGKEQLVHSFLEEVIEASGDKESAKLVLRSLISDESTRLTLPLDEIAKRTQRSHQSVSRILSLLAGARLVTEIQEDEPWRYELMHEYLIEKIIRITGRVMDATERANRLFRQYLSQHAVDSRTRIPIGNLWFIRRYSDVRLGERERKLLRKSLGLGLLKTGALAALLVVSATAAAAALSVDEEWESVRLSDGHTAAVRQAAFSPDGRLLVSGGEDRKIIVWDFNRRQRLATFSDHEDIVTAVDFSPDGKWFATSSFDKTVIVWNAARLEKAFVLRGHSAEVLSVVFSEDGRFLLSAGAETISWRVGGFEKITRIPLGTSSNVAVLPSGSRFTIATDSNEVILTDSGTGKSELLKIAGVRQGYMAVSPDGRIRMCIDGAGIVQFADLERSKLLRSVEAHRDNGRWVTFSPDGKLAASASENVILWDARTQTRIAALEHDSLVWNCAFSPDGRWLVSTHADGAILVWDVADRRRVANLNEHSGAVYSVAYSGDGSRIASTGEDGSVIVWNSLTVQKEAVLIGYRSRANGVAFLPDGERLVSTGFQEAPILWDIRRGEAVRAFVSPRADLPGSNAFALSPDGHRLATSNGVYDTSDGRLLCNFIARLTDSGPNGDGMAGPSHIYGIAFSQDGRLLACSTAVGGYLGLFDTATWDVIAHVKAVDAPFISLSFSPDARLLATGEDDGKVELWRVNPLERVVVLGRHAARVKSVAFSPDGKQVVSSSDDKTIALWNVGSRSLAARIDTHTAPVRSVAFSPDGKHIVSGEHDKSVRVHTRHRMLWGYRLD